MTRPRTRIPRISKKRLASLGGTVPFSSVRKSGKPKPKKRKPSEFKRIYGSEERTSWVTRQPCVACHREASALFPSHNHHTETGGTSRKGDYTTIVPLCSWCHTLLHQVGRQTMENLFRIDLTRLAAEVQRQWEDSQ